MYDLVKTPVNEDNSLVEINSLNSEMVGTSGNRNVTSAKSAVPDSGISNVLDKALFLWDELQL